MRGSLARTRLGLAMYIGVAATLFIAVNAAARLSRHWTYQEMFDASDLVIIAIAQSSKDTGDRTTLPDYTPRVDVVPVLTKFESFLILKGPKEIKKFDLFHYRYASGDDEFAMSNTPFLIRIEDEKQPTFLLFLSKRDDETYEPVTGQTDPAFLSVLELRGAAD